MDNEDRKPPGTPVITPRIINPPPPGPGGEPGETPAPEPSPEPEKLKGELAAAEAALAEARAALETAQRRAAIEREVARSQPIDAEVVVMLCETAAKAGDNGKGPDAAAIVADFKKRKPYLFRTPTPAAPRATAMAAASASPANELERVADEARSTGDRRALLRYLRLRRST